MILDIFSRYVVGWLVAERESAALAERLIEVTCDKQVVARIGVNVVKTLVQQRPAAAPAPAGCETA